MRLKVSSLLAATSLFACGQIANNADGGLDLPDSAGAACHDVSTFAVPPTCESDAGSAGTDANDMCQQWADGVVGGAGAYCSFGACVFDLKQQTCTPCASGDAQCQAWAQGYSKSALAYGKCRPLGPNDPASVGNVCILADQCIITSNGMSSCSCGGGDWCDGVKGMFCLGTNGAPSCRPWCE